MKTNNFDLTLDICTEDGARTRFCQNDEPKAGETLRQLVSPRLFNQPMLTLASPHSLSAIPTRTIDMILAHTTAPPRLPLPLGWVDVVQIADATFLQLADPEPLTAFEEKAEMLVEIHTVGDWMIRLKLETILPATVQERRHLWNHFLDLPAIPFHLQDGGIGAINPAKIVRVTVCPPVDAIGEMALAADLLQSVRS